MGIMRTAGDCGGAFRSGADAAETGLEAALQRGECIGKMDGSVGADIFEVAEGGGANDDPHAPRKRTKTAAISSSVAKRQARA